MRNKIKLLIATFLSIGALNINAVSLSNANSQDDIEAQMKQVQEEFLKIFNLNSSSNIFSNLNNINKNMFKTYPKMNKYESSDYYTYEFELPGIR